jgi:AcrR family transcriptional regulator
MQLMLSAAHDLFAQRGYAAVTMDEVAAAAGVTKPLLYNYFGNKERLYIACMERAGDDLLAMIGEAVASAASPGDALAAGLRAFFDFLDADRAAWAVLFAETSSHVGAVAARVADYRAQLAELVASSLLAQLPLRRREAARVEVEALSAALLGAAEALARWWLRTEAVSSQQAAELLISTVEPGLRARSSRSRAARDLPSRDSEDGGDAASPPASSAAGSTLRGEPT